MLNSQIVFRNGKSIGKKSIPFIISELACAHDGEMKKAFKLIDASVNANADAVQLQFFVPKETVTPHHKAYNILEKIKFTKNEWKEIFDYAFYKNILVFVCTYDMTSVEWSHEFGADGIKLNSADLSNPDVIKLVSETNIPFTLGTGASTMLEIANGLEYAISCGAKDVALMHGVQNFPTKITDLNISRIRLLLDTFDNIPVGYADHTQGDLPCAPFIDLIALGLGAQLFEKHITWDRTEKGIDYQAALEPEEYKIYVDNIKIGFKAYGSKKIRPFNESEIKYRKFQKKSIVACTDINVGECISRDKIVFLRNENPGMPPIKLDHLIGKKVNKIISKFQNITLNDIQ